MEIAESFGYIATILGVVTVVSVAFVIMRSSTTKTTIQSQSELIDTLIKSKDAQKDEIAQLRDSVNQLKGQVDTLRNLPLKEISAALGKIAADQQCITNHVTRAYGDHSTMLDLLSGKK